MGNLYDSFQIRYVILWIPDALDVDSLRFVIDGGSNLIGLVDVDKLGLDAESREKDLELVVSAAVEVARRDDVIAGVREGGDGDELRRLAGGGR